MSFVLGQDQRNSRSLDARSSLFSRQKTKRLVSLKKSAARKYDINNAFEETKNVKRLHATTRAAFYVQCAIQLAWATVCLTGLAIFCASLVSGQVPGGNGKPTQSSNASGTGVRVHAMGHSESRLPLRHEIEIAADTYFTYSYPPPPPNPDPPSYVRNDGATRGSGKRRSLRGKLRLQHCHTGSDVVL